MATLRASVTTRNPTITVRSSRRFVRHRLTWRFSPPSGGGARAADRGRHHLPLRYATEDIALGADGPVIRRTVEAVLAPYGAAGRRPALHGECGDRFDVTRSDKQHLSFGSSLSASVSASVSAGECW